MSKKETQNPVLNQALYTKYRSKDFESVRGQSQVTEPLSVAIKSGQIAHAYLFTGSRGIGKTSVARIFASQIGTTSNDLYEIDAASNTGVDDIRALNENVYALPYDSKYKVFILDEVHMLSKSAFNAFLKTLEEPPSHVVFILATTEPEKIPDTVISRCEVYNFRTPNRAVLKQMVLDTAEKEGFKLNDDAGELIALMSEGSFRDAHTILQKIIRSSGDKKISIEYVEKITGAPKTGMTNDVLESLVSGNKEKVFEVIAEAEENNFDPKVFGQLIVEKFRAALMLKVSPNKTKDIEKVFGEDEVKFLQKIIEKDSAKSEKNSQIFTSQNMLSILRAFDEMHSSSLPFLVLEIELVRLSSISS